MKKIKRFFVNNSSLNQNYGLDVKSFLLAICCYCINPAIATLMLFIFLIKGNKFIAFHAFHSAVVSFLLSVVFYFVISLNIGFLVPTLRVLLKLSLNLFSIYGSYQLMSNRTYEIPFISNFFYKYIV